MFVKCDIILELIFLIVICFICIELKYIVVEKKCHRCLCNLRDEVIPCAISVQQILSSISKWKCKCMKWSAKTARMRQYSNRSLTSPVYSHISSYDTFSIQSLSTSSWTAAWQVFLSFFMIWATCNNKHRACLFLFKFSILWTA